MSDYPRAEQMTDRPNFLTTAEVAAIVRAPAETVRYWRHIGTGPKSFKISRRVLYDEPDVMAWIDEQRRGAS